MNAPRCIALVCSRVALGAVTLCLSLLAAVPAWAHDFWIEPSNFRPAPGEVVNLKLKVGVDLAGEPAGRYAAMIKRFVVADDAAQRPVGGREGADPAGAFRVGSAAGGLLVVGYHSQPSYLELPGAKFTDYLAEEGLDGIIERRAARNESAVMARELYARCAKSLLLSGPVGPGSALRGRAQNDRRLGMTLELVAERNPYDLAEGELLPIQLTYEGRPLPGALVVAVSRADPRGKVSARSDTEGRVRFALPPGAMWLVKAVHMVEAPPGSEADWVSHWASLTFEVKGEGPARTP